MENKKENKKEDRVKVLKKEFLFFLHRFVFSQVFFVV